MRKFIILNIALTLLFGFIYVKPQTVSASASTDYRRIITDNTPFYSDTAGTSLLFYLPYTYYVKVLEHGEVLSHVECYGTGKSIALDGYVPTNMLYNDNLPVQTPYLEKEIVTLSTAVLYSDKELLNPLQYVFASRELVYYGQLTSVDGSIIFYVGYNNRLGYLKESDVYPFEIPFHPNSLTFIEPEQQPTIPTIKQPETNRVGLTTVRTIIVLCLFFAGVIALFVAIKKKPRSQQNSYYDENEYE